MATRTCPRGHKYVKSSNCPVCPICEKEHVPGAAFHALLSAPARRALESHKINTLAILATWSEAELLSLHGFGPGSIPVLKEALKAEGLALKKSE